MKVSGPREIVIFFTTVESVDSFAAVNLWGNIEQLPVDKSYMKYKENFLVIKNQVLSNLFREPESRYKLLVGFKFLLIPLTTSLFMMCLMYMFMKLNYLFFEANGFDRTAELREAYYGYIANDLFHYVPLFAFCLLVFFGIGLMVGGLMLRPFKAIAKYCQDSIEGFRAIYDPEDFSDFRLLTRMSEFFFSSIEEQIKNGELVAKEIPRPFTRIHGPKLDRGFLVNILLLIIITQVMFCSLVYVFTTEMHNSIVNLALNSLQSNKIEQALFFSGQTEIINMIIIAVLLISSSFYFMMAYSLYSTVAGGSFGVFATMRAFLRGRYDARIHLVGYQHLRNYTRIINKYLDYLQSKYTQNIQKTESTKVKLISKNSK